jgi:hypothetical protein
VRATSSSPADSAPGLQAGAIRASLEQEARRLLAAARAESIPLCLLGGMAIRLLLGERLDRRFERAIADLDFITTRRAGAAVERLLAAQGWAPERRFNALNGARRLLFEEPAGARRIDIFVGEFRMCHALPLAEHLRAGGETLSPADLLLTKLQIVALNAKDRGDLYALLLGCATDDGTQRSAGSAPGDAAAEGPRRIALARIAALTACDWGLHHTVELNLERLRVGLAETELEAARQRDVEAGIAALARTLAETPKSRAWRLRARIGERRRWYEDPEEIAR